MTDSFEMSPKDYQEIQKLPGNDTCIDCGCKNTEWGSVSFGILFCAPCSGGHRGLGTHISRVRSVKMDSWSEVQMKRMKQGGNQQCKNFLASYYTTNDINNDAKDFDARTIRERYDCPAAELYKDVLTARIEGKPEPTKLPVPVPASTGSAAPKRKMEGFGSSPPPTQNGGSNMKMGAWKRIFFCFRCCLEPPDCD